MDEVLIRNALNSMLEATEDDATPIIRRLARVQARAALDTLASAPAGVNITVRQKTPVVADYGDNFLVAQVSADGKTVGIDHPCDAVWSDVDRAQTALRDYINERIAGQDKCPFKPRDAASAPPGDGVERELTPTLIASARGHLANVKAHGNAEANACLVFEAVLDAAAALARPRAAVGERAWDNVVATEPCQSADETDEDGNSCWYIEIQSVGGHSIVATIWGGSPEEVQSRVDAILGLQSPLAKVEGGCPSSPDGRHQVDTTMESGSNNCFHCEAPMGGGA